MIQINEDQIRDAALRGVNDEIGKIFSNRFTVGNEIETLVRQVINTNRANIQLAVDRILKEALDDPEFVTNVRAAILEAFRGDFVRAFDGVASGAGRKAATEIGAAGFIGAIASPKPGADLHEMPTS